MPYAIKDDSGRISSLHRSDPGSGAEFLSDDDVQVREFLGAAAGGSDAFSRLDADFVRVIEDLIDVLMARNIINLTDLPETAQAKLFARKGFRDRAAQHALMLFQPGTPRDVI